MAEDRLLALEKRCADLEANGRAHDLLLAFIFEAEASREGDEPLVEVVSSWVGAELANSPITAATPPETRQRLLALLRIEEILADATASS